MSQQRESNPNYRVCDGRKTQLWHTHKKNIRPEGKKSFKSHPEKDT